MFPGARLLFLLILLVAKAASLGAEFEVLHSFTQGPRGSIGDLCEGADGEFFGIATSAGAHGSGAIFKVTADGTLNTLHSFEANEAFFDYHSNAGLVRGADGNFYGISDGGGLFFGGTFYRITPSGEFTVLHHFSGPREPAGALTLGVDGNFYGFTARGQLQNVGTIFKMTPAGTLTVLHSFDANVLHGAFTLASDGNLYGAVWLSSVTGEPADLVVKMTPAGEVTVLHRFTGTFNDPQWPAGRLVEAADGKLYGVLQRAGPDFAGAAYRLSKTGEDFEIVHTFTAAEGSNPIALTLGGDGQLYGLFNAPSDFYLPVGRFFRMTLSGDVTILHRFEAFEEGRKPAGIVLGRDGNLYGSTSDGGTANRGAIFRSTLAGSLTPLAAFADDGFDPRALIHAPDGYFYGYTGDGGEFGGGVFFRISADGVYQVISPFRAGQGALNSLLLGRDGLFYGTSAAGNFGGGSFFQIGVDGQRTVLYQAQFGNFGVTDLIEGESGIFCGILGNSIVRLTRAGEFTTLKSFPNNSQFGFSQIARPLAVGLDGNIYGNNIAEGDFFRLTPGGDFSYLDSSPPPLYSGLTRGFDGNFYGTTASRLFRLTPTGNFSLLGRAGHDFSSGILTAVGNRIFLGDHIGIERIDPRANLHTTVHVFSKADGSVVSALVDGDDGFLYAATRFAGSGGGGAIGRVPVAPAVPLAGEYCGFVQNGNITTWGTLRVSLTSAGQFSGTLWFDGERFAVRGALGAAQDATIRIVRKPFPALLLHISFNGGILGGTLQSAQTIFAIGAQRALWGVGLPAPQAGKYTLVLSPAGSPSTDQPQGNGYAVMDVTSGGQVTIAGRLADGIAFSTSSLLTADGTFPFTITTAMRGREGLAGTVTFRETAQVSDCDCELLWRRNALPIRARFADGFYQDVRLFGSRYTPPAASARILALDAAGHATAHFSLGGLPLGGIDVPITISPAHRVASSPPLLSMAINPARGWFTGTFAHPSGGRVRAVRGVFLQKQNRGAGFFLGPAESGAVSVTPAE